MYKKSPQGWLKHWDFILLDIFCLQLAFVVAYLVRQGLENPYSDQIYRTVAFVFMLCQIVVMFLGQSYQDILKRGYYIEFTKTAKHVLMVMLLSVLYLFATQQAVSYSRLTLFYTAFLYLCFDYVGRVWHKENVLKKNATKKKEKSMVVVVSLAEAKETIEKILSSPIQNFSINGIALIDDNPGVKEIVGIPVVGNMDTISEYLCHEWVDEVFVKISETEPYPQKLIDEIITMGLTVHLSLGEMEKSLSGKNFIEKIGGYSVITSSINTASPKQLLYKRLMDIAGGIVGCLLTVILIVVIGPMIYIKSPGPIFFSQVRIGKNGKKFKIYKFRSMYMDAEERKAELMSQNKMEGLMFKMDYDPRIIGSEKKDKNGNPKGIGNFIRKTSLDEFPQFWNVLKGDMSLVGTRPPTVDEWEQYELHHRSRMSIKPGITGMWQASGRSDITDFEEVVKLDTEYIEKEAGITEPKNLEEQAISLVGRDIYEKLIKGYTEKQWGRDCKDLPSFIIKRLPVRLTFDNNYFNALYQGIPVGGYTKMVANLLDGIEVRLNMDYLDNKAELDALADKVVYTGAIDAYFDYKLGTLESWQPVLSDNGGVTRGICKMDAENNLTEVVETKNIIKTTEGAEADGMKLDIDSLVSMNMWGLTPDFLKTLEEGFKEFFEKEVPANPLKAEYLIPTFIGELLSEGKISVKALRTNDTWYGMTYKEDVAAVKESFSKMLENGTYKGDLFSDL